MIDIPIKRLRDARGDEGSIYFEGQAEGAWPNGSRVKKVNSEIGDGTPDGMSGTIVASHGPIEHRGRSLFGYFVLWDNRPQFRVFVVEFKLELVSQN